MTAPETTPSAAPGTPGAPRHAVSANGGGQGGGIGGLLRAAKVVRKSARRAMAAVGGPGPALSRVLDTFRREGVLGLRRGLALLAAQGERLPSPEADGFGPDDYQAWIARYDSVDETARRGVLRAVERLRGRLGPRGGLPRISVLLTDGDATSLTSTLADLRGQLYPDWELLPALSRRDAAALDTLSRQAREDRRIRAACPGGTPAEALAAALDAAQGEFMVCLRAGDGLPPHALFCLAAALCANPAAALAFGDEDSLDETGLRCEPLFKPDFDPELLISGGLPLGLAACRTELARRAKGPREGFGALTGEELAWRTLELARGADDACAVHVPRVLLHRGSPAPGRAPEDFEPGLRMSRERLARLGLRAKAAPAPQLPWGRRVSYERPGPDARVSILIPTRDRADLLGACLHSLLERTVHTGYEVIVVDNGSREDATFRLFESLPKDRVRILRDDAPFNFSRLNNLAAREARGAYVCMLNNDIEVPEDGGHWLGEMLSLASRPGIGCVGARLWYPDGTLQHGGIIVGLGGSAGHAHRKLAPGQPGYGGRALLTQCMSAVTAACLLVRKDILNAVGGLDEGLPESYNDVDFCLRVQAAGYRNVWTPFAELVHHESASRRDRADGHAQRMKEFDRQASLIMRARRSVLTEDPAYNPNLTRLGDDFGLAWPPRVAPLALL